MDKLHIEQFILASLKEDVGDGDHTSLATIDPDSKGKAKLLVKDSGILAGVELATEIFRVVDPTLTLNIFKKDGEEVNVNDIAFEVYGAAQSILKAERLVLNCMQRMSGIATITHAIMDLLKGTKTKVLDTRKTTPGIRFLEKWAVVIGGGVNHRFGLYDMILIKDNHVDYAGGIINALTRSRQYLIDHQLKLEIEIEVRNLNELSQVLEHGGADRIMFDNFNFNDLKKGVAMVAGKYVTEASGGITIENVTQYAECGVDFISVGALTHSVKSLDLSLKAF